MFEAFFARASRNGQQCADQFYTVQIDGSFPKLGDLFGVPTISHNVNVLGSILGSRYFGNLPNKSCGSGSVPHLCHAIVFRMMFALGALHGCTNGSLLVTVNRQIIATANDARVFVGSKVIPEGAVDAIKATSSPSG